MLRDLQAVAKGHIFPFFAKNGGIFFFFFFSYSKVDTAVALVFIMYDGSLTNNLLVVILFYK